MGDYRVAARQTKSILVIDTTINEVIAAITVGNGAERIAVR